MYGTNHIKDVQEIPITDRERWKDLYKTRYPEQGDREDGKVSTRPATPNRETAAKGEKGEKGNSNNVIEIPREITNLDLFSHLFRNLTDRNITQVVGVCEMIYLNVFY